MTSEILFGDFVGGELGLGMDLPDNGPSLLTSLYNAKLIDK